MPIKKRKLSDAEMWELYTQGYSLSQIGAEAGVTGDMVRKILMGFPGYQKIKQDRESKKYQIDDLARLIGEGRGKKEIMGMLGLSKSQLNRAVERFDLDQIYQQKKRDRHDQDMRLIWELHQQGMLYKEISERIGRSQVYINKLIHKHPEYKPIPQRRDERATLIRLGLLEGKTMDQIAEGLGISRRSVRKYLGYS